MSKIKLINGFLVTEKALQQGDCLLDGGRIKISDTTASCEKTIDLAGKYILPGFVDIHFHGYDLFDFTEGRFDPQSNKWDDSVSAYQAGLEMLRKTLPSFGVTGFYAASLAESVEKLKNCFGNLTEYLKKQPIGGARIFGGLLEGTFIHHDMAGAQNPDFFLKPSREAFDAIEDHGAIKLALVGPDSGDGAIKLTKYLTDKGVTVGAGHTNATCEQVNEAVAAGLKYCIHFTNGPTGNSYKPFNGGGAVEAVLKSDEIYAELIADGYHVNPAYIRDIIKRKGADKIIGMTDCQYVAGSSLKSIELGGVTGKISEDGNYLKVANKKNTLFGSNLTMNRGFENILNWLSSDMEGIWNRRHEALEFDEALCDVTKIYSTNPCRLTGLADDGFGVIADGAQADLCVLDISGSPGEYKVEVGLTIVDGNIVYSAS